MSVAASFSRFTPLAATAPAGELGAVKRVDVDAGGATPFPKMDKSHEIPDVPTTEAANSPHPTRRVDIQPDLDEEVKRPENADSRHKREVTQIGEQVTEHQDVTKASPYQGDRASGSWN